MQIMVDSARVRPFNELSDRLEKLFGL